MADTNRKIAFLFNPVSGTGPKAGVLKLIEARTFEQGIPFKFFTPTVRAIILNWKKKYRIEPSRILLLLAAMAASARSPEH